MPWQFKYDSKHLVSIQLVVWTYILLRSTKHPYAHMYPFCPFNWRKGFLSLSLSLSLSVSFMAYKRTLKDVTRAYDPAYQLRLWMINKRKERARECTIEYNTWPTTKTAIGPLWKRVTTRARMHTIETIGTKKELFPWYGSGNNFRRAS